MRIVQYAVIESGSLKSLQETVNYWISQGWQPLGGICTVRPTQDYYQAMVRYE